MTNRLRLAQEVEEFARQHKFNGQALYPMVLELVSQLREQVEENERLRGQVHALLSDRMEVHGILAEALGYPYDEDYGWVTGDHTELSLADEAKRKLGEI